MYTEQSRKLAAFLKENMAAKLNDDDIKTIVYAAYQFSNDVALDLPDVRECFSEFVKNQKQLDPDIAKIVNDNFWDLL